MKLNSIRVEGFKRFRDAYTLADLTEGINLIAAPNGSGKSTLAEAIRVAFLERSRVAKLAETLAPWTDSGATPRVQIEFEHAQHTYRLAKVFSKTKNSCSLDLDGQTLTGKAAEDRLAEMFAFSYAHTGVGDSGHHGVPGLLWVRQGTAGEIGEPVRAAHTYLGRSLGGDFGQLAASQGDQVIEAVKAELEQLVTLKAGKPTGEFFRAQEELKQESERLQELEEQVRKYVQDAERLGQLQEAHAADEAGRPWEEMRKKAAAAGEQLQVLQVLQGERAKKVLEQQVAAGSLKQHADQLAAMDQDEQALQRRQEQHGRAVQSDEEAQQAVRATQTRLEQAQAADAAARATSAAARRAAVRVQRQQQHEAALRRSTELADRLSQVEEHLRTRVEQQTEEARLAAFQGAGKKVADAEKQLAAANAALEAVATRLEYEVSGEGVQLDGQPLTGAGAKSISEPVDITLAGVGRIRVLPGAQDLTTLRRNQQQAQATLDALLQGLGVANAAIAQQSEADLMAARSQIRSLDALIAQLAPDGADKLRSGVTAAEAEALVHEQALADMPAVEGEVVSVEAAEAQELVTQGALERASAEHSQARQEATRAQEQLRQATQELEAAQARVSAPGRREQRDALNAAIVLARAQEQQAADAIQELDERIAALRPEQIRQDIDRFSKSASAAEAAFQTRKGELDRLAGELGAKGAIGLEEEASAKREVVARLTRMVDERTRRAAALRHLLDLLEAKRAEVARSIRAPLQMKLNHYLQIQYPGTTIEIDDDLRPTRWTRAGPHGTETGSFEELSGGEREQLGIIARFAYADLLKAAGKPTLVILDDSLVNSDRRRLDDMKRVIYDAGTRHQILVFTCHGENWQDMGVPVRTLQ